MYEGSIATLTPTVCALFGIPAPSSSLESPLESIARYSTERLRGTGIERCLIYCPDALGDHVWSRFPDLSERVARRCPHRVSVSAAIPPKTPVCFASLFTGAPPEVHGIRKYERPVLSCDTLFDAVTRSGRRVAIVAVRDSSIDLIFRNRPLDFFSERDDQQATLRALAVIASDAHELVVVYHQEYDDELHRSRPFSRECVAALQNHVGSVQALAEAARSSWSARDHAFIVAPDHGAHLDLDKGVGDHGLDIPEDMAVSHWYGVFGALNREARHG